MTVENNVIDVLVRFHDMRRFGELDRCVFSLVTQTYSPLRVNLLTQRFSEADVQEARSRLAPLFRLNSGAALNVINFADPFPKDARARLLNVGLQRTSGRFVAILDYDDTIYPEAYTKLVSQLEKTGAAIAFASVVVKHHDVFDDALIATAKERKFVGKGLIDLFHDNFCPIHSFVIDRARVPQGQLYFSELLARLEDYDLLLRLAAELKSDFGLVQTVVGDYYFKNDGSNTVQIADTDKSKDMEDWARARDYIAVIKEKTHVSLDVQRQLGLPRAIENLTIAQVLRAREKWLSTQQPKQQ